MAKVRVDINQGAINRLCTDPRSPVWRQMNRLGSTCSVVAKIKAPVNTSRLRDAIDHVMVPAPPRLTARVRCTVNYAKFVHEGHPEIRPKTKKALRFVANGEVVFATRVKALAGRPFLVDAVEEVTGKKVTRRG